MSNNSIEQSEWNDFEGAIREFGLPGEEFKAEIRASEVVVTRNDGAERKYDFATWVADFAISLKDREAPWDMFTALKAV